MKRPENEKNSLEYNTNITETLSEDIILEITWYLDAVSTARLLSTTKQLWKLRHKSFVIERTTLFHQPIIKKRWNVGLVAAASKGNFPQIEYFLSKGADDINRGMYEAARIGNLRLVEFFIEKGACRWNVGMKGAALGGHKDLVNFFINKGAEAWSVAMTYAYEGGHRHLIDFFHQKDTTHGWGHLVIHAAKGGHKDLLIELMNMNEVKEIPMIELYYNLAMTQAASQGHRHILDVLSTVTNEWGGALQQAAASGDKSLVDYVISKGGNNWELGLQGAARGGHKDIVLMMIEKGAKGFDKALQCVAEGGNKELVDFLLQKGSNNWNGAFAGAVSGGHEDLVKYLVELNPSYPFDWNMALRFAALSGNLSLVNFVAHQEELVDWERAFKNAITEGYINMVMYFVDIGVNYWKTCLHSAIKCGDLLLVKFFLNKDPENLLGGIKIAKYCQQRDIREYLDGQLHSQ